MSLGDDFDPLYSRRLQESDPIRKLNRYIEGGPGSGPKKSSSSTHDASEELSPKQKLDDLKYDTLAVLSNYGQNTYRHINSLLRDGGEDKANVQRMIDILDKAYATKGVYNETKQPMNLYRGIDHYTTFQALSSGKISKGDTFSDKSFLSTSKSEDIGMKAVTQWGGEHGVLFEIGTPAGTRYLAGRPDEKEFVLNRGSKLKIQKIEKEYNSEGGDMFRVKCSIVPSKSKESLQESSDEVEFTGGGLGHPDKSSSKREAIESFGESFREGGPGSGPQTHAGRRKIPHIGHKWGLGPQPAGFKVKMAKKMFSKHFKELDKEEKKKVRAALRAEGAVRPAGRVEASEAEKALREAKIINIEPMKKHGVEDTRHVFLEGGMEGVFKVLSGPDWKEHNEVSAWALAKIVGLEGIHPPVVEREIKGEKGSLMQFWNGQRAGEMSKGMYDGNQDLHKAALFDYIIVNRDRHDHNWLVSPEGKLQLIDHERAFPQEKDIQHFSYLMDKVVSRDGREMSPSLKEMGKVYVDNKSKIWDALKDSGLNTKQRDAVESRIDKLENAKSWTSLFSERKPHGKRWW